MCTRLEKELGQEFSVVQKLNEKVLNVMSIAKMNTNELLRVAKDLDEKEKMERHEEIKNLYQYVDELSNDMVCGMIELVCSAIQHIDDEIKPALRLGIFFY